MKCYAAVTEFGTEVCRVNQDEEVASYVMAKNTTLLEL